MNVDEFQTTVGDWHLGRFPDASLMDVYAKLVSEVGEIGDALLGPDLGGKGDLVDEVGDVLIVLLAFADRAGFSAGSAARQKFDRVGGTFNPTDELQL
jgi:hypothetical protein